MTKRELEFSDGKSEKFWRIELHGDSHTVNYGRLGTAGQTKTKEFATPEEAQKSYDKLVAQKLKKGYVEAGGGVAVAVKTEVATEEAPTHRRDLEYQDDKSHKFWRIELDGASHTVCYGKVGTDGQSKTKSFDDEAQAQKSFDKLVAQKLKKGYGDVSGSDAAVAPASATEASAPSAQPKKAPAKKTSKKKAPPAERSECVLKHTPEALFWVRWRQQEPPKPPKFDPEKVWKAKKRFAFRDWGNKKMFCITFEEALFWLVEPDAHNVDGQHMAMWESLKAKYTYPMTLSQFDDAIQALKEREKVPYQLAKLARGQWPYQVRWAMIRALMKAEDWFQRFLDRGPNQIRTGDIYQTVPFFTPEEKEFARGKIRDLGPLKDNAKYWKVAAALGMTDEIKDMLDNWTGDKPPGADHFLYVALDDPNEVYERLKNSGVSPWGNNRQYAFDLVELPYLAHTEDWGLDLLMPDLLKKQTKKDVRLRFSALAGVQSPRTVACMLEVIDKTEVPELAHKWLLKHHTFTLPELFRLCQDENYKEGAQEVIRRIGLDKPEVVEAALTQASDQVRALVQSDAPAAVPRATLEPLPKVEIPPLTEGSIPFVRKINIYQEDWYAATWREREPLQRKPVPFDKTVCAEKIRRLYSQTIGADHASSSYRTNQHRHYCESAFDWPHGHPSELSQEEAQFWAHVILGHPSVKLKNKAPIPSLQQLLDALETWDPKVQPLEPTNDGIRERLTLKDGVLQMPTDLPPVLTALLPPREYLDLWLVGSNKGAEAPSCRVEIWSKLHLIESWFRWGVIPYLSDSERSELGERLRQLIKEHPKASWTEDRMAAAAQALGLPECQEAIDSGDRSANKLLFGVQSKEALLAAFQQMEARLWQHEELRYWLAHTEYEGFEQVEIMLSKHHEELLNMRRGYYESGWAEKSETTDFNSLWSWISTSPSPEMAAIVARLDSKQKPGAKRDDTFSDWLRHNPKCAVPALVHMAIAEDTHATYAVNSLRAHHLTHDQDDIRAHMAGYESTVQRVLERKLFEPYVERGEEVFEEWLTRSELFVEPPKTKLKWINVAKLPAVTVDGHTFNSSQLEILLYALMASTPEVPHPHVTNLRSLGTSESFDDFTWHLFELWIAEGGPPKQSWAMEAWGHLASEKIAHKVFPLMKKWPGDKKHKWSLAGLASLQAMGTDGALSLVNSLATKLKFKGLKEAAGYVMNRIAKARGLTREEFADRVIPDCGLDERGERIFDFGARKFSVVIDGQLKVQVRDEEGKIKKSLPKAGSKDDAAMAKTAAADFKMVKSQVADMAKIQPGRLENAMRARRFWSGEDMEKFFVRHPFMSHLAKRLVWGVYKKGALETVFRVTNSFDYANDQDDEFKLGGDQIVGLVHPLELSQAQLKTWDSLLADYEIVPPFAQLQRPVYSVDDLVGLKTVHSELMGGRYPAISVKRTLESQGWKPEEDSFICYHRRTYEEVDLVVQVDWRHGYHVTMVMEEELEAGSLRFMRGGKELDLEDVEPIILSEVFLTLSSLASVARV